MGKETNRFDDLLFMCHRARELGASECNRYFLLKSYLYIDTHGGISKNERKMELGKRKMKFSRTQDDKPGSRKIWRQQFVDGAVFRLYNLSTELFFVNQFVDSVCSYLDRRETHS